MRNGAKTARKSRRGATSTEYILILVMVVLPIGFLFPLFLNMAKVYAARMTALIGLPFP